MVTAGLGFPEISKVLAPALQHLLCTRSPRCGYGSSAHKRHWIFLALRRDQYRGRPQDPRCLRSQSEFLVFAAGLTNLQTLINHPHGYPDRLDRTYQNRQETPLPRSGRLSMSHLQRPWRPKSRPRSASGHRPALSLPRPQTSYMARL